MPCSVLGGKQISNTNKQPCFALFEVSRGCVYVAGLGMGLDNKELNK